ncbi:cupredoxin domain-containing protein [Natronococcus wangiae]|uniref:cupredoxin domain-containing protein n=1 Tax=Natronococcus wangiae TaxID=3068275 RepID=UPI00273D4809|nr:plastocyanin/azurin family copper-binding protein [Natronococcus sp. AD5]
MIAGCLGEGGKDGEQEHSESDGDDGDGSHDQEDGSSHDHGHDDHEVGQPDSEMKVEMTTNDDGNHFAPHVVHVESGGTVEWVLESGNHDTVAYHPDTHDSQRRIPDGADPWESDLLDDGDTFEQTFEVDGVYDYVCTPHEETGMVGTVVVGWPDPADQPGLNPPADDLPDAAIEQLEQYNERVREALENGESHENGDNDGENNGHDDHGDDHGDHDDH